MEFKIINIKDLDINPENIRKKKSEVQGLLESIRENGVKVPFEVTPTENGRYLITDGNTRAALIAEAGLDIDIPCLIVEVKNRAFEIAEMLSINNLRENLSLKDTADAFKQLSFMGIPAERIAKRTGQSEETVNNLVKIAGIKSEEIFDYPADLEQLVKIAEIEAVDPKQAKVLVKYADSNDFEFKWQAAKRQIKIGQFIKDWSEKPWYEEVNDSGGYKKIAGVNVDGMFYRFENWNKTDEAPYEDHEQIEALTDAEKFWKAESDGIGIYIRREEQPESETRQEPEPEPEIDTSEFDTLQSDWETHVTAIKEHCAKIMTAKKTREARVLYYLITEEMPQDEAKSSWLGDMLAEMTGNLGMPFGFDGKKISVDEDILGQYTIIQDLSGYAMSDAEKKLYSYVDDGFPM